MRPGEGRQGIFAPNSAWAALAGLLMLIAVIRMPSQRDTAEVLPLKLQENRFQVDINCASLAEFQNLPGIGKKLASRIVDHRSQLGTEPKKFHRLEDLLQVKGISKATLDRLRPHLSLGVNEAVSEMPAENVTELTSNVVP